MADRFADIDEKDLDLQGLIIKRANDDKLGVATILIERAKKGDATALKILEKALSNQKLNEEQEEFPLNDDQYKRVILIRARRLTGNLATREADRPGDELPSAD